MRYAFLAVLIFAPAARAETRRPTELQVLSLNVEQYPHPLGRGKRFSSSPSFATVARSCSLATSTSPRIVRTIELC